MVMRYVKAEPASSDVHLWSSGPGSVLSGYHKVREWVKGHASTATSWGWGDADGIVEMTKGKLTYHFGRSLPSNDNPTLARIASDYDDLALAQTWILQT